MTLKTALIVQPSSSRNRIESQSISLSTGNRAVFSVGKLRFLFSLLIFLGMLHMWYNSWLKPGLQDSGGLFFSFASSALVAHSAWKVISPGICGLISDSESLDFSKNCSPYLFFQFLCFPLLDLHLPRRTRESWLFLSHLCTIDNTVIKTLAGLHCISSPRQCLLSVHPVLCCQLQARDLTGL